MATRRAQPDIVPDEAPAAPSPKAKARRAAAAPTTAKAVEVDSDGNPIKKSRRAMGERNWLAREIDRVLRAASGPVTVHDIVLEITNKFGEHPSSGAVAAALKRWSEQGYITINPKPLGFKAFPAASRKGTLDDFLEKSRETRLTARRATRAA